MTRVNDRTLSFYTRECETREKNLSTHTDHLEYVESYIYDRQQVDAIHGQIRSLHSFEHEDATCIEVDTPHK